MRAVIAERRSDLLLPAALAGIGTVETLVQDYRPLAVALATFWLAAGVLAARRRFPLAMPLVVFAIYAATPLLGFDVSQPASWLLLMATACLSAGLHAPRARRALGLGSVVAACSIGMATLAFLTDFKPDLLFGAVITLGPWFLGAGLREALERNRELAADAERARLEHAHAVERAAAAERERIARELHDVLAHSLSVMVVQASLAEDLLSRDTDAAGAAMREVQQSGRAALGETASLLRLIRDEGDELGMQPRHVVADIPALAAEYERAGLRVDVELDATSRALRTGVGLSAYRIVQEALTNALKHAPGSRVSVRLARRDDELEIEVRNGPAGADAPTPVSGGHGLVGIRERVSFFGGTLTARPTGEGGFLVAATLPTPPEQS